MEEERKRVIAIVAGIIIAAVLCIPTDSLLAKPNESNAKKETKATDHTPNSVISTNREETKPDEHKTQARLPKWYASSEWWLVIVAALTAVFIAWQAKETANATKAMRDGMPLQKLSADAALLNAQAVINAERPWIFIEESESAKAADHRQAYVRIMGRNKGRTPAEITVVSCVFGWIPYDHEYPDEPEYPPVELKYKKYVSSDESFEIYDFNCATSVLDGMWAEFGARRERLTFTGRIIYRDVITAEEHETRFCYFLSPHGGIGLIMVGPRNYNKHT